MKARHIFFILIAVLWLGLLTAQEHRGRTVIHIEHADYMEGSERFGRNVQALFGNVRFRHHNTLMHCDSAFFHRAENKMHAYGSIHIIQDDSIHLYGNILHYHGDTDIAMIRENVRLVNNDVVLRTEYLDYDRRNDVAYYFNGGLIESGDNILESVYGYYYPRTEEAHFQKDVVVTNPEYFMYSDTLVYYTLTEIVKITGPTTIESERNIIYAEAGFYDTQNDVARLEKNGWIKGEEQFLSGDTIFYDRTSGFGEVFSNMFLQDTTNHVIITGDYGFYNELTKEALATKRAVLKQIHQNDTLYLHADTLRADPIPDTELQIIRAYRNVKFFREDFQGRCDSMVYDLRDSINSFYIDPVLWAMGNQMSADIIRLFTRNNALYKTELINNAFVIAPEDTIGYNQIKGNHMVGHIRDNKLYRIDVDGNGQTIYFPKEDDVVIGMNRAESSNMTILLEDQQVTGIILRRQPAGNLNPPALVAPEAKKLNGFRWLEDYRPKRKEDIFIHDAPPVQEGRVNYDDFLFDRNIPSR
ncbi:OstA-like protein [Natronoflexus pectinivorans]|uniref:OstA-like protein n=1 Tax=Natronoflexus pectinivorans TaxID=682526 RepID=A0A4R2GGT6_9BACT|nr:OstA-like protein [Natronoflexus pectinivorans]TCO07219.1 OstA-like protein [Natronoflexus pectinivorans]